MAGLLLTPFPHFVLTLSPVSDAACTKRSSMVTEGADRCMEGKEGGAHSGGFLYLWVLAEESILLRHLRTHNRVSIRAQHGLWQLQALKEESIEVWSGRSSGMTVTLEHHGVYYVL
jgi:hypothetical protein